MISSDINCCRCEEYLELDQIDWLGKDCRVLIALWTSWKLILGVVEE